MLITRVESCDVNIELLWTLRQTLNNPLSVEPIRTNPKKKIFNILAEFVPKRIGIFLCKRAGCDVELWAVQLKKDVRKKLIADVKAIPLSIERTREIAEAMVTRRGVSLKEIESKTMGSKICTGLFFAGEVLDVDGLCGGYNLQIYFSTWALAGATTTQKHSF